jgi:hypothetical protein
VTSAAEPATPARQAPASAGLNQLNLKLELPQSEPVHVRFVERAGEIHVVVRSDQPGASTRLASGLDQFQTDLAAGGSQVEAWTASPESDVAAAAAADGVIAELEPVEPIRAAEQSFGQTREQSGGNQREKGALPEWAELLSEREDEAALRRLRNAAQRGSERWRQ